MDQALESCATLPRYRWASAVLLLGIFTPSLTSILLGGPDWVGVLGLPFDILLVLLTYKRLRDAAPTGGWIVLMIFVFNFGPSWHGYRFSLLINFIPMVMGWIVPAGAGAHPRDSLAD